VNKSVRHIAMYYDQHSPAWTQCAKLIASFNARAWNSVYVHDEHSSASVQTGLSDAHAKTRSRKVLTPSIIASSEFGFQNTPVRVSGILASLRAAVNAALERGAKGVLFLIEMTWAIRTPSGAVYLREYEAAIHELTLELPVAFACLHNQHLLLASQLLSSLLAHPNLMAVDGLHENPHFVPPRILARQDERAHFRHWLEGISPSLAQTVPVATSSDVLQSTHHVDSPEPLILAGGSEGQWKIRCFGPLRVYRADGSSFDWRVPQGATRKTKTLFAYLLFRGEQGASSEELVDLLWPNAKQIKQGLNRLHHTVNSLRHVLRPDGQGAEHLRLEAGRYSLAVPEHTWLDYPMFQELCYQGNALLQDGDLQEGIVAYQSAERIYTGDFLADIPLEYAANEEFDWCWGRRYWFKEMHLKMLSSLSALYRQSQQLAEALTYADKALRLEPCSEIAHREKMLALHAANRRDAVERQYRLYLHSLERFGMGEPSSAVTGLYESLRGN
jgi:two-component SAPR family response regulator